MSDFCYQCSEDMFGDGNLTAFKGLTTKRDIKNGKYALVLCEDCGLILVDPNGRRVREPPNGCLVCFSESKERR